MKEKFMISQERANKIRERFPDLVARGKVVFEEQTERISIVEVEYFMVEYKDIKRIIGERNNEEKSD